MINSVGKRDLRYLLDNAPEVNGVYERRTEDKKSPNDCVFYSVGLCFYLKWDNFGKPCKEDCKGYMKT